MATSPMKSCAVRSAALTISNVRVGCSLPFSSNENSKTEAWDPPPTQSVRPLDENARPSHASATRTRPISCPSLVSSTLSDGGRYPPLRTTRKRPSGERADDMGSVSSGICTPAGLTRQPLFRRNPPSGRTPTCSRAAGWEAEKTAIVNARAGSRKRFAIRASFIQRTAGRWENGAQYRMLSWLLSGRERLAGAYIRCDPPYSQYRGPELTAG